ncbi:hypothetical protein [Methylomonas fluvii]|uniref:Uncharacterized protein n=1 Tax=Methylomonas fluvii TaxID=1854564 RepID=A0ABR9DEH9_9GAMM|nr:hypothetical protein [Methylomonas fluvii]MBD9361512.1 hypothetical protein [Methylomonas fluvii]CAD6874473.1 hypothetical protein [Methylomonas fluvii]
MPKIVPSEELERIEKLIAQYPEGIGAKDIAQWLDFEIKGRTLQRRLATLVAERRIVSEGDGRALKYKVVKPGTGIATVDGVDDSNRQALTKFTFPFRLKAKRSSSLFVNHELKGLPKVDPIVQTNYD